MQWLGEEQMIYRHQEMYSDAGARLAFEEGVPLIGVRENFLGDHHFFRSAGRRRNSPDYGRLPAAV